MTPVDYQGLLQIFCCCCCDAASVMWTHVLTLLFTFLSLLAHVLFYMSGATSITHTHIHTHTLNCNCIVISIQQMPHSSGLSVCVYIHTVCMCVCVCEHTPMTLVPRHKGAGINTTVRCGGQCGLHAGSFSLCRERQHCAIL